MDELDIDISEIPEPVDLNTALLKLLESPNIASKALVYRQFDQTAGIDTVVTPGSNAAVLRVKGTKKESQLLSMEMVTIVILIPMKEGNRLWQRQPEFSGQWCQTFSPYRWFKLQQSGKT